MAHFRSFSSSAAGSFTQTHQNDLLSLSASEGVRPGLPERKSSKSGNSFWTRRSLKRSNTANSTSPVVPQPSQISSDLAQLVPDFGFDQDATQRQLGSVSRLSHSRSFNPDSANETMPSNDPLADVPQPGFKVKYNIHNPLGPRWYRNHHLIPPTEKQPSARPPTFFSTHFPPISTSSTPDNIQDTGTLGRRASTSPQPTPASSQTRVGEGIKPRSRKTSQTAPDNVDLMDVTDPWGTNWHHDSPYDILAPPPSKLELDVHGGRPRRASMTAAQGSLKAVAPSPLSQSTSAVHLHDLVPEKPPSTISSMNIALPRKLSKRRNPNNGDLSTLFTPPTKESEHRRTSSAPPTPIDRIYLSDNPTPDTLPKRMSVAPPVNNPFPAQPLFTPKREKRSSFVGRIAKKFNLFRRSEDFLASNSREYSWLHVNPDDHASMKRPSFDHYSSHTSSEKVGPPKRVTPPSLAHDSQPVPFPEKDNSSEPPPPQPSPPFSYISLETPFSIGKLTVANPDFDSETGSPIQRHVPLRADFSVTNSLSPPPSIPREQSPPPGLLTVQNPTLERASSHYDKPLPVPAAPAATNTPSAPPEANPAPPSRRATVVSVTSQKTATQQAPIPTAPPPAPASVVDSDSDTDSSDTDSSSDSSEEQETSFLSNKAIPPDSTVNAAESTLSTAAPALPPKEKPTPSPTPEAAPISRVKSQVSMINNRSNSIPPEAAGFARASLISGVSAEAFVPLSPEEMTSQDRINSYLSYTTDSPCSTTSMLANPPTPFHSALPIDMDPPAPPPLPAKEVSKDKESKKSPSPTQTPTPPHVASRAETPQVSRNHSSDNKETITSAGQHADGDAKASMRTRSSKEEPKPKRESHRKDGSIPTSSSPSSSRHNTGDEYHKASHRQSKQQPSSSNVMNSSVYNRYLEDAPPARQHDEAPPPPPPRDDSSSKRRMELRKEREKEKEREREREEEARRAEERRRREERRRYEEERRFEEEQRERERQKEKERARRRREREREEQKERERERERELRRQQRELERERERERERLERERLEWERMERERERERQQREIELRLQMQRQLEMEERERERQRLKELERERERERERLRELERERERERERVRELEREKERLRRLEKEREKERQRLLELEREKERLSQLERERARELERERERLRQLELERERERLRQIEEREKEREKERKRKEREERKKAEKSKRASQQHLAEQRLADESRSRHKRESRRSEDERHQKSVYITPDQSRAESYYANATQSIYLSADPEGRVERRPSTATTRPTSELPSTADMNALRAKEAWDMERMWKARSMYGAELNGNAVQSIPAQSVLSFSDNLSSQGASYGSSYTAFSVQTPFAQGQAGSSIYQSMPLKPPPFVYGSPASIPSLPDSALYDPYDHNNHGNTTTAPRQRRTSHNASSPPDPLPVLSRSPLAKNPLPAPPRESTYQPAPLPPLKPATATVRTSDYWA